MKQRNWFVFALIVTGFLLMASAEASSQTLRYKPYRFNAASQENKHEKIAGPATIVISNVNILRYDVKIGVDVSFTKGPDLKLPFIPPLPQVTGGAGAGVAAAPQGVIDPFTAKFSQLMDKLKNSEKCIGDTQNTIAIAIDGTNAAKDQLETFISGSDAVLKSTGGAQAIIDSCSIYITGIDNALKLVWPNDDITKCLFNLESLKTDMLLLPATPVGPVPITWATWYQGGNKLAYDNMLTRINDLQVMLKAIYRDGSQAVAFRDAQNKLRQWKLILEAIKQGGVAGFTFIQDVDCGFAFDQTKSSKVELVKHDRLAAPDAGNSRDEIVTVECTTPLSISAGFGFSTINEREFVFVQSTKMGTQTVVNQFGFKNQSSFRTLPVILLNTRIKEWNDTFALHASVGAGVDVKTGQAGTDVEYVVGGSLSFKRSLFITPALHIGRVPTLVGGFKIGDEVPAGISTPPVEKAWKRGFAFTFTYKIR
jgi:hypothetical protein